MADPYKTTLPGLGHVGSYQVSGHPYLSGNAISPGQQHAYFFPNVTKRIQVQVFDNSGSTSYIRVHFAPDNANNRVVSGKHWWQVGQTANQSYTLDVNIRCTKMYVSHDTGSIVNYQIFAELTNIPTTEMYELTGTGISI